MLLAADLTIPSAYNREDSECEQPEETNLRPSERLAAIAVSAMTAPAFFVFPALGLWYVTKVWPGMSLVDRTIFCCALAAFLASMPICWHRLNRRLEQGLAEGIATTDRVLLAVPILAGGWALTHSLPLFMIVWMLLEGYLARKGQRK